MLGTGLGRPRAPSLAVQRGDFHLRLLGGFELRAQGRPVSVASGAARLVAFLALRHHALSRSFVGGALWPDSSEDRAHGNLRSVLWRLNRSGPAVVDSDRTSLRLASSVSLDVDRVAARARALLVRDPTEPLPDAGLFLEDLLPDWYDEWLTLERERFRQLRLHALETLSGVLAREGRYAEAVEAAQGSVLADPLRESSHRALVNAHLAEGNRAEALRQFQQYSALLGDELGLEPSPEMRELVAELQPA